MGPPRKPTKKGSIDDDADRKPAAKSVMITPRSHDLQVPTDAYVASPPLVSPVSSATSEGTAKGKAVIHKKSPGPTKLAVAPKLPQVASRPPGPTSSFASLATTISHPAFVSSPVTLSKPTSVETCIAPTDLTAFGFKPAGLGPEKLHNRDSMLKCCVIEGPYQNAIVFHVQPIDPKYGNGSWTEKCFADAIRLNMPWVASLAFDRTNQYFWFHENHPQKNPKDYLIRMFVILAESDVIPKENIVQLANYVCSNLNATPNNKTKTSFDENSLFWLGHGAVWSDIMGYDAALTRLLKETGTPAPGYYEEHRSLIHSYFHCGTFDLVLAQTLHAPVAEIHPALRNQVHESDDNSDEDEQPEG